MHKSSDSYIYLFIYLYLKRFYWFRGLIIFFDLIEHIHCPFQDEEFLILLEKGVVLPTRNVHGSDYCLLNVFPDQIIGRAIIAYVVCLNFPFFMC